MRVNLTKTQYWELVEVPKMTDDAVKALLGAYQINNPLDDTPMNIDIDQKIKRLEIEQTIRSYNLREKSNTELENELLTQTNPKYKSAIDYELQYRWILTL